jgi:GTP-binding protein
VPAIPIVARTGEGMQTLLTTVDQVIRGEIRTQPRRVQGTPEFQRAVDELVPKISQLLPELPQPRWIAIRLLDGDHRLQQALLSGELDELVHAQRRSEVKFSSKIALDGRQ